MQAEIVVEDMAFPNGNLARAVISPPGATARDVLDALAVDPFRALVVVIGGAGGMSAAELRRAEPLLADVLMPFARQHRIAIVDGGTDAGVPALLGLGAAAHSLGAPLIGVCPGGAVRVPGQSSAKAAPLEPHHTHFVLTHGNAFGDESEMMYALIELLGGQVPSAAVLVNGGMLAMQEALRNTRQGRVVLVCRGTGRAADEVAEARTGETETSSLAAEIAAKENVRVIDVVADPHLLALLLQDVLWGER